MAIVTGVAGGAVTGSTGTLFDDIVRSAVTSEEPTILGWRWWRKVRVHGRGSVGEPDESRERCEFCSNKIMP